MCGLGTPVKRYLSLTVLCLYPFLQCRQCSVMQWFQPASLLCLHYSFHLPLLVSFLFFCPVEFTASSSYPPSYSTLPLKRFHTHISLNCIHFAPHGNAYMYALLCRHCYKWSRIEWLRFKIVAHTLFHTYKHSCHISISGKVRHIKAGVFNFLLSFTRKSWKLHSTTWDAAHHQEGEGKLSCEKSQRSWKKHVNLTRIETKCVNSHKTWLDKEKRYNSLRDKQE